MIAEGEIQAVGHLQAVQLPLVYVGQPAPDERHLASQNPYRVQGNEGAIPAHTRTRDISPGRIERQTVLVQAIYVNTADNSVSQEILSHSCVQCGNTFGCPLGA